MNGEGLCWKCREDFMSRCHDLSCGIDMIFERNFYGEDGDLRGFAVLCRKCGKEYLV